MKHYVSEASSASFFRRGKHLVWWTVHENTGPERGEESEQFRIINIR
jgi:hypothetical protein